MIIQLNDEDKLKLRKWFDMPPDAPMEDKDLINMVSRFRLDRRYRAYREFESMFGTMCFNRLRES